MIRSLRITLCLSLVALAACAETTAPRDGVRLSVFLTDAPGDVRVWASFSDIYLQGDGGRTHLLDAPTDLIEVTALVGVVEELVGDLVLPMSSAGQLRVVVDQAVLEDGEGNVFALGGAEHPDGLQTTGPLRCPSCSQSGLKVRMVHESDDVVLDSEVATLLLDFDVSQSFGKAASRGGSAAWIMSPVIIGTLTEASSGGGDEIIPQGMVRGLVQLPFFSTVPQCPPGMPRDLGSFVPTAEMEGVTDDEGNPLVRTGSTDAGGRFEVPFLAPGTYELGNSVVEFETHRLVFSARAVPGLVSLAENQVVEGVTYQVASMACEAL